MRFIKNRLLTGTLVLTAASFISRILGFFYRMFLSRTFGEENMGIYQLITPVIILSYSLSVSGIETSISKYIAQTGNKCQKNIRSVILQIGIFLSVALSILTGFFLFEYADFISAHFLMEPRCTTLVRIFSVSLPLSAIHSCIMGYYYGIKQTAVPAFSQLIEQLVRIFTVYLLCTLLSLKGSTPSVSIAVVGLVAGETASALFCLCCLHIREHANPFFSSSDFFPNPAILKKIVTLSIPLTLSRLVLNLFHSIESVYIPNRLLLWGLSTKDALSQYGVLTGMVFPLIFVPSTLTNSLSTLLLPYISEADSLNRHNRIVSAFRKCVMGCLTMGALCGIFFYFSGDMLGRTLFHSPKAGSLIVSMSLICPFLYLSGVLTSILHGLGRAGTAFRLQLLSLSIRLFFVFFAIPLMGMKGYLTGILASQLTLCITILVALKDYIYYNKAE